MSVVGIGEDGVAGLGERAKALIGSADIVFGGRRHLALAASVITGEARAWPSPLDEGLAAVSALGGRSVCVLASGDPFCFGVGASLARRIAADEMEVVPGPSAFSLAAARLGWAMQDIAALSLHGRALDLIRPHLQPGGRIVALTSDEAAPASIAALLVETGFGRSRMIVLERLGGPRERIRRMTADGFDLAGTDPLNVVAIAVEAGPRARVLPLASGREDGLFEHDGQITKRDVRALTLSALAPRRGELLWDIGAGAGSVAVEWLLAHPSMRAIAVEGDGGRAARIVRNAAAFGVPGLRVVTGMAPHALTGLERPDAVFVGGGGRQPGVLDHAADALPPGGRLVVNAVTLELEALLLARHATHGGELLRIALARAEPVGRVVGWRPAMPVTQWRWTKP